ncbi:MAG TPA: alpha-glucan family phosphorylase, partial [Actinomycetota bacterium]
MSRFDGAEDVVQAAAALGARLPPSLQPLARVAYNYRWSWAPAGADLFSRVDRDRWSSVGANPVRLLHEAPGPILEEAASDAELTEGAAKVEATIRHELQSVPAVGSADRPVVFLCAEFGIHRSLPIYAGGLGILAGDILKEASDLSIPFAGVGILYRQGYFHQRLDASGWQHEYWSETDPDVLPAALVTGVNGEPLTVSVPVRGHDVVLQVWRVDVGRVPLFLLDAHHRDNPPSDRWITARLYVGERRLRLAQYAVLGVGGLRALRAMGVEPALLHLNEGHAALAPLELAAHTSARGGALDLAWDRTLDQARHRTVFTTHTPVSAGNETYAPEEVEEVLGPVLDELRLEPEQLLRLGRVEPDDHDEWLGLTPLGLRVSRAANAVSERHGHVARAMWRSLYRAGQDEEVPISHVTNGVHLPTWMALPMQALLDRYLAKRWREAQADPRTWAPVEDIPDEELWAVRQELRAALVEYVRGRTVADRLARDEPADYAEAAARAFDPSTLTVGFARRVAGYKRLTMLVSDPDRATALLSGSHPIQLLIAGKAHPQDELAKGMLQSLFTMKWRASVAERVAFLEDYDMAMAAHLVSGCDLWLNVPRPP